LIYTSLNLKFGLEFDNLKDAWKFLVNYDSNKGFEVRKYYPKKNKKKWVYYFLHLRKVCENQIKETLRPIRPETRNGCVAIMKVKRVRKRYKVVDFVDDDNHSLHPLETIHILPSQRKITYYQAYDLEIA